MKVLAGLLLFLAMAAPPAAAGYEATVKGSLRDPESARFYSMKTYPNGNVCGYVNAKNGFGGYVGKLPFAVVSGAALLDLESIEIACEMAASPRLFLRRREQAAAKAAEVERAAETQRYTHCLSQQAKLVDELTFDQLHVDVTATALEGQLKAHGCPPRFFEAFVAAANGERRRVFELYCGARQRQRLLESIDSSQHAARVSRLCGPDYLQTLRSSFDVTRATHLQQALRADPATWTCRVIRDYGLIGDPTSRAYWAAEFARTCAHLQDRLDEEN